MAIWSLFILFRTIVMKYCKKTVMPDTRLGITFSGGDVVRV